MPFLKSYPFSGTILFLFGVIPFLNGCATLTAIAEGSAESMTPTVMASLDSFESAALSIQLSNRVLSEIPISEGDRWPSRLQGKISGRGMLKMGLSLTGSTQGVTIPTEIDPQTGFPRPTSALYIFLKEREKMLNTVVNREDSAWFRKQPKRIISRELPKSSLSADFNDPNLYRNVLMAYGVVTGNRREILEMEQEIENISKGFRSCNLFLHQTTEEIKDERIIKRYCPDPALKDEDISRNLRVKARADEKREEKERAEKAYGRLAANVYKASVAGADFTAAAITKIAFAATNGIRALPNIKNEFAGVRGAYNLAMIIPRAKNIFNSIGIYKKHLTFQWTTYRTMYQQINETYRIEEDDQTGQSLGRIRLFEQVMADIGQKIDLLVAGSPSVRLTDDDISSLDLLVAAFARNNGNETLLAAHFPER